MRSYEQFCGLARALDTIGDRWNLLIVRELLIEPRHYTQLQRSLPGIASNLLAERLRALQAAGVIKPQPREDGDRVPYALTPWGEALREPINALLRWSIPLMVHGRGDDVFDPRWLSIALEALLHDRRADPARQITLNVNGTHLAVRIDRHGSHITINPTEASPAIATTPELALAIAAGANPDDLQQPPDSLAGQDLTRIIQVLGTTNAAGC